MKTKLKIESEQQKERQNKGKWKKKMKAIWDLWNNIKYANLSIIEEEREKWADDVFGWKFPKPKEGTR